jgi:alpha-D-ribose 1-methylphosphonate 5-triphosphate diphosphatase PhnM
MRACFVFKHQIGHTQMKRMTRNVQRRIATQRRNEMYRAQRIVCVRDAMKTFHAMHDDARVERVETFARFVRITYVVTEYNATCVADVYFTS